VGRLKGSLFLRLSLLVVLTIGATQIFTWWLVANERRELIARHFYGQIVDSLADYEGRLDTIAPAERNAYLSRFNRPWQPQLLPITADHGLSFNRDLDTFELMLANRLSSAMGETLTVKTRLLQDKRQLWISVHVLGAPYWLIVPMGRIRDNVIGSMMQAALLATLFAILIASAIAWRTTLPISRVVRAARELEEGRTPETLDEGIGSREVRALTQSFNRMSRTLQASASERRLMLAGLSHDLRTPLTRLKLMVELQGETGETEDMLSDIDEMSGIVRQFIDFARSEEQPRNEPVALAELASSVVARFTREHVPIHLTVQNEPEIMADPLALERLLGNLIDNARRYGRPPIEVEVAENNGEAELIVTDHGDGIACESRQAALAPFERLATHRGTDGGSGLGLAIVSRVVKQHEGTLQFEDIDGGFRIRIRLPLHRAA
jgi:two-component system, OmpR family, osmolarity sensor histidine kinase EnvZ